MSTRPLVCREAVFFFFSAVGRRLQAICTVTDMMTGDASRWYSRTSFACSVGLPCKVFLNCVGYK